MEITETQFKKRLAAMPLEWVDKFSSDELAHEVDEIAATMQLDEAMQIALANAVGMVFMGFINRKDLEGQLLANGFPKTERTASLAGEVDRKILAPIGDDFWETWQGHLLDAEQSLPENLDLELEEDAPEESTITPGFSHREGVGDTRPLETTHNPTPDNTPPQPKKHPASLERTPQQEQAGPAVIHEHVSSEDKPAASGYSGGLVRPSFYEEPQNPGEGEDTPKANLEIGGPAASEPMTEPRTMKVGKEEAKVVHYSTPQTVDPFAAPKPPATKPAEEKVPEKDSNVHDNNVVDLKDLPK